jgi:hypothetical protein
VLTKQDVSEAEQHCEVPCVKQVGSEWECRSCKCGDLVSVARQKGCLPGWATVAFRDMYERARTISFPLGGASEIRDVKIRV